MKIDGWHIDGYGVHHDAGVADLPDGLTIVAGPNEAGKTTLQDFLVGMLFGFTAKHRPDHHVPLRGGTYGGRLLISDDDGHPFTISRGARRSSLQITGPDGPISDPDVELHHLLGGASKDLYQSIFAVHTDELVTLQALEDDRVRERVFSAGVLGAGRTAQAALSQLSAERDELWKPGGRSADKYAIKRLRASLVDARAQLAEVRRAALSLPGLVHRMHVVEADREREREQRSGLQTERSLIFAVSEIWPSWADAAEARSELDQLGAVAPVPADGAIRLAGALDRQADLRAVHEEAASALAAATEQHAAIEAPGPVLSQGPAIDALAAAAPRERERLDTAAEHQAQADHLRGELADALEALGQGRDAAWLATMPDLVDAGASLRTAAGAVDAARQQLTHLQELHRRSAAELADALAEHDAAEAALAEAPNHPVDRARHAAEQAASLAALVGQRDAASHRFALAERPVPPPSSPVPAFLVPALLTIGGVVLLAGLAIAVSGPLVVGVGAALGGAALAALGLAVRRSIATSAAKATDAAEPTRDETDPVEELATLDRAIDALVGALGLDERPSIAEAANLRTRAAHLADEAARIDRERAAAAQRREALMARTARFDARCAEEAAEATEAARTSEAGWTQWLDDHGLSVDLDPISAGQVLDGVARARALQRSLASLERELQRATELHESFRSRVEAVVGAPVADPLGSVADLATALQEARHAERRLADAATEQRAARRHAEHAAARSLAATAEVEAIVHELGATSVADAQRRVERAELAAGLARRVQRAERDLAAAVGNRPEQLDAARTLLLQADPTRWRHDLEAHDATLRACDHRIDDLTTELAHLQRERDDLEQSADVPRWELQVADLEAQLLAAVSRWASLTVAHQLVEGTLARYQRERQPEVVRRAAAHFAQVTDGRYHRLEVRDREVVAIDRSEREVPAEALSKGAIGQLYLCMRFALAESYARTTRLPLLLDDITVHADDGRLPRLADTIAAVAAEHQVIVFTCHDATVELLKAAAPNAHVLPLDGSGPARRIGLAAG